MVNESVSGKAPGFIRVACATDSGGEVDGHFGSVGQFKIFDVSAEEIRAVESRASEAGNGELDKNAHRVALIRDCQLLCLHAIGGPAAARVTRAGIMPLKFPQKGSIAAVLESLKQRLSQDPPPWLKKAMSA